MLLSTTIIIFCPAQHFSSVAFMYFCVDYPFFPWKRRHCVIHNSQEFSRSCWNYYWWKNLAQTNSRSMSVICIKCRTSFTNVSSLPRCPAHLAGFFCSDQVWTQQGKWSLNQKNLIHLPCNLQVNHYCLSWEGDGNYILPGSMEQIL